MFVGVFVVNEETREVFGGFITGLKDAVSVYEAELVRRRA